VVISGAIYRAETGAAEEGEHAETQEGVHNDATAR